MNPWQINNKFQRESGGLVDIYGNILHWVIGAPGLVHIPTNTAIKIHQRHPGLIHRFTHIHPPGMTELSSLDKETFSGWVSAFSPFPFRFGVITESSHRFVERVWVGQLEDRDHWEQRTRDLDKNDPEYSRHVDFFEESELWYEPTIAAMPFITILHKLSYES